MTRRTGFASLLSALLLFATTVLPGSSPTAAAASPLGCVNGIVQVLSYPGEVTVSPPVGTAPTTAHADERRCADAWDYGDAPAPYRTTRAQHGPRHLITIVRALTIGTTVTPDANGRPGVGDVDDGLVTPVRISVSTPQVTVRVRNTTGSMALLAGWLDTSGHGFAATERAMVRVPVGATHAVLRWTLPAGTPAGVGELRLRLYQGLPAHPVPIGAALGGEVEDYRVTLLGPPTTRPSPSPTPTKARPSPTPTMAKPQPAPATPPRPLAPTPTSRPTPTQPRLPTSTPAARPTPMPSPTPTQPAPPTSTQARPVTHAKPWHPRRGFPLTWSIALLIVIPAAAGAAHAIGRAARRRH
jgi:hypothetical protein